MFELTVGELNNNTFLIFRTSESFEVHMNSLSILMFSRTTFCDFVQQKDFVMRKLRKSDFQNLQNRAKQREGKNGTICPIIVAV